MTAKKTTPAVEENGTDLHAFATIQRADVPKGRQGKHKRIITRLLADIEKLKSGTALKVPLTALPDSKENIRSALNRATHQRGLDVATSSDNDFLYIWVRGPKA